jgi:hypothetical protein
MLLWLTMKHTKKTFIEAVLSIHPEPLADEARVQAPILVPVL